MHLTADITTDDNYKAWVVMQALEPPGLSKYKRTQVLMDESQKKKQKRHYKNGLMSLVLNFLCYVFPFSLCIVIEIAHAMFKQNFISITFIN